tara:strand:+ start:170 stop:961 length:792 start_codon:yes stop_codon:yes gene_type:complete
MLVKPFGFINTQGGGGIGYGNPPYEDGLIVYYDFGDNVEGSYTGSNPMTNGATVYDLSGNGVNSILNTGGGSQIFEYIDSQSLGVVRTVNTKAGGRFEMPALTGDLTGLSNVTLEFFINAIGMGGDNVLYRFDSDTRIETNLQQYGSPPKRISADWKTEEGTAINYPVTNQAINDGFHHIVYTGGVGEGTKVYFDGTLLGTGAVNWPSGETMDFDGVGSAQAWMGTQNYAAGVFLGDMAVFRIYSSTMPAASVTANYNYYSAI